MRSDQNFGMQSTNMFSICFHLILGVNQVNLFGQIALQTKQINDNESQSILARNITILNYTSAFFSLAEIGFTTWIVYLFYLDSTYTVTGTDRNNVEQVKGLTQAIMFWIVAISLIVTNCYMIKKL
jgi:hypothetical protein